MLSSNDRVSAARTTRLRRQDASRYLSDAYGLQCAPATLAKLACLGGGPRFQKAGRFPLYPVAELDAWATEKLGPVVASTSDANRTGAA